MNLKKWFRTVGILEAVSFLGLLGIAMPMKYLYDMPEATRMPGMLHGVLFMAYIGLAFMMSEAENWSRRQMGWALVASILPLGTLVYDWKYLRVAER